MQEGKLGQKQDILLTEPLDTWNPSARGSSARVFLGLTRTLGEGRRHMMAIKFMRPDERDYAAPLFKEEVQILFLLREVPGAMRMLELGYIHFDNLGEIPPDNPNLKEAPSNHSSQRQLVNGRHLTGHLHRYLPEETEAFLEAFDEYVEQGWLPYLGARLVNKENNLLLHCDEVVTRGRYFSVENGLEAAYYASRILAQAHQRHIIYRDHKIVHYYWNPTNSRMPVTVIDWNVGKYYPTGLPENERRRDLAMFAVNTLYYIFTGRRHPQALHVGPVRLEEVEGAPSAFEMDWRQVVRPLDPAIKVFLEKALRGEYHTAEAMQAEIETLRERFRVKA